MAAIERVEDAIRMMEQGTMQITLEGARIGPAGVERLARAIESNTQVSHLLLSDNAVGDEGAHDLAQALKANTHLQKLELGTNSVGDTGARHLAEALQTNTTLEDLELQENSIGDAGASSLAEVVTTNTSLTVLLLCSNSIGEEGVSELMEALELNRHLKILCLCDNPGYSQEADERVKALLYRNVACPARAEQEVESRKPKVLFLTVHLEDGEVVCCYKLSGCELTRLDRTSAERVTVKEWALTLAGALKLSVYRVHLERRSDSAVIDTNSVRSVWDAMEAAVAQD